MNSVIYLGFFFKLKNGLKRSILNYIEIDLFISIYEMLSSCFFIANNPVWGGILFKRSPLVGYVGGLPLLL